VELKKSRVPIGICGLVKRDFLHHPDLGFAFLTSYQKQGFASEAAMSIIEYGFGISDTLLALTTLENQRSLKTLVHLGMKPAGTVTGPEGVCFQLFSIKSFSE
jgi:[ribosomal protein S5]-alanine N-acetyltransferase